MKTKLFGAPDFTATKFHSAQEKADFANHLLHFINLNFKETLFTKKFYNQLSNSFGNIAHYNKAGFYYVWFSSEDRQAMFIRNIQNYIPCGSPEYTYSDVERKIQSVI